MRRFITLSGLIARRFFSRRSIVLMMLLLALAICSVQMGIREKNKRAENMTEFQKLEITFFNNITNYSLYSNLGFKVVNIPGDSYIFYSHPETLEELSARVNSIITLDILQHIKSGLILRGNSAFSLRFSSIIKVLGSLLVLFLGLGAMRNLEFYKSLSCQWPPWLIHLTLILSHGVIVALLLCGLFAFCLGLAALQGVSLTAAGISFHLHILLLTILFLLFFFLAGVLLGYLKSKYAGFIGILAVWILLIFLFPSTINSLFGVKTFDIDTSYKLDARKLKIVNDFEMKYIKERGGFKNYTLEEARKIMEGYYNHDFKEIEAVDEGQKQELAGMIGKYSRLMRWMPVTFYELTVNEASSQGYLSYLDFYSYLQDLRRRFFLFWKDRVYYQDPKVMVNFVKDRENLFFSKAHIPGVYWHGILINLLYLLVLGVASHVLFTRSSLHISAGEIAEMGDVALKTDRDEINIWLTRKNHLKKLLFNLFSGRTHFLKKTRANMEILIDGVNAAQTLRKHDLTYFCHQDDLPGDLKVVDLLRFYARWRKLAKPELQKVLDNEELKPLLNKTAASLEPVRKLEVNLALLELSGFSQSDTYLIDDLCKFLPLSCAVKLLNRMEELKKKAVVIYLVQAGISGMPPLEEDQYYEDGGGWLHAVLSEKARLRILAKKNKEQEDER